MGREIACVESYLGEVNRLICRGTGNLPSEDLRGESIEANEQ